MKTLSTVDFLIDGILRFIKGHDGERPIRLVISPETWRVLCDDVRVMPCVGSDKPPTLHGVPIVTVPAAMPRLVAADGKSEEI